MQQKASLPVNVSLAVKPHLFELICTFLVSDFRSYAHLCSSCTLSPQFLFIHFSAHHQNHFCMVIKCGRVCTLMLLFSPAIVTHPKCYNNINVYNYLFLTFSSVKLLVLVSLIFFLQDHSFLRYCLIFLLKAFVLHLLIRS